MGCCSASSDHSQFLYELRYGETSQSYARDIAKRIEEFSEQLNILYQIAMKMKGSFNMNDFDDKEFYQTSNIFLERYVIILKEAKEKEVLTDQEILSNLANMRDFYQECLSEIQEQLTGVEKRITPSLVIISDFEKDLGQLGECKSMLKNEKHLIKMFTAISQLDQQTHEFHQAWIEEQVQAYEIQVFKFFEEKVVNQSENLENVLQKANNINSFQIIKDNFKSQSILEIEKIGIFLAEQVLKFKDQDSQLLYYSQFNNMAKKLEKTFMKNYEELIIKKIQTYLNDLLNQAEITLTSLLLINQALKEKSMEIFDNQFYSQKIHESEIHILILYDLQKNFDNLFTKYQKLQLKQQHQQLGQVIKIFSPLYKTSMKQISTKISENISNYFQMRDCIQALLKSEKRKEQKIIVFFNNFGQKVQQDLKDIQKNQKKFLDLQGLEIKHDQNELQTMMEEYKNSFNSCYQQFVEIISNQINDLQIEIQNSQDQNNELLKKIDQNIGKIKENIKILQQIKQRDANQLFNQLFQFMDKNIYDKNQKRKSNQISDLLFQLKQQFQGKSTTSMTQLSELNSPPQSQVFQNNTPAWMKVKRILLKIENVCQKCKNDKQKQQKKFNINQIKHDLCQTNYLLDMNGIIKCEKRTISSPKEKICKKKNIQQFKINCQFCSTKYQLDNFFELISNILPGLNSNDLPFEQTDMFRFYPQLYYSFSKLYSLSKQQQFINSQIKEN